MHILHLKVPKAEKGPSVIKTKDWRSIVEAMCRWEERNQRAISQSTVKELISNNVYERRRYYVCAIENIIQFLAVNELLFRSDYDNAL